MDQFDAQMRAYPAAASVEPVLESFRKLLANQCFVLAALDEDQLTHAKWTTAKFRTWWNDGGREWLESYLLTTNARPRDEWVTFPPSIRRSLFLEDAPGHPLSPLLCGLDDAKCGAETEEWLTHIEQLFRLHALENDSVRPRYPSKAAPRSACIARANKESASNRYGTWRHCVSHGRESEPALPIGRFRSATDGWLILSGRRGYSKFCDEVRAYDLASGSAYIARSCGNLVYEKPGSVDLEKTEARRTLTVTAGHVELSRLREAARMVFLARYVEEHVQRTSFIEYLPKGIAMGRPAGEADLAESTYRSWSASHQTKLNWAWLRSTLLEASGAFDWPDASNAGDDVADMLLRIAEATFVEDCPVAPLPKLELLDLRLGVSPFYSSEEGRRATETTLKKALESLAARAAECKRKPDSERTSSPD